MQIVCGCLKWFGKGGACDEDVWVIIFGVISFALGVVLGNFEMVLDNFQVILGDFR